jgi:Histone chaperone Rttp106-like
VCRLQPPSHLLSTKGKSTLFPLLSESPQYPASRARGSFIKCYHGADEGLLFPTKFGLLFATKPLLFLSHDDIDAMDVSRGGVSFRTFDLNVKLKPPVDGKGKGKSIEFRMLPQEEMEPLKRYVAQCAFRRDQSAPADTGTPTAAAGDGESKPEAAANSAGKIEDGADETAQVVSSKRARPSLPVYNDQESDDDDEDEDDESFGSDSDGSGDDSEDSYSGGSIVVSDYNSDTAGLKRDSSSESSTDDTNSDTEDLGRLGDDDDEDAPLSSLATKRQKTSEE